MERYTRTCQCGSWHTKQVRPTDSNKRSGVYHTQQECFGIDPQTGATCLWKSGQFKTPGSLDYLNTEAGYCRLLPHDDVVLAKLAELLNKRRAVAE